MNTAKSKLDLDHLASLKWNYIHKRFRTPFFTFLLWEGVSKTYNHDFDFDYPMPDPLYLDRELMFNKKVWDGMRERVVAELKTDFNFIINVFKQAYALDDKIVKVAQKMQRQDFSHDNDITLAATLEKYINLSLSASAFALFPLFLEEFLEQEISQVVKEKYGPETKQVMQTLTTPAKQSSTQAENISFLKIAIKYSKGKNIDQDIQKHLAEHAWLKNTAMDGNFYSIADVQEKLDLMVKEDSKQKLADALKEQKNIVNAVNQIKRQLKVDKRIVKFIDTLQEAIYFRSWRTERYYRNAQYLQDFFALLAQRVGFDMPSDLFFLTPFEVLDLLRHDLSADKNIIAERRKGYLMFADGQETNIYSGAIVTTAKEKIDFLGLQTQPEIIKGQVAYPGQATGRVCVIRSKEDFHKMQDNDILVSHSTTPDYVPIIKSAQAIVTDEGGVLSHASVISREMKIPCVIGTKVASKILKDGDIVEVDAKQGIVKIVKEIKSNSITAPDVPNSLVTEFFSKIGKDDIILWDGAYSPLYLLFQWNNQKYYNAIYQTPASPILEIIAGREASLVFNNTYYCGYAREVFQAYWHDQQTIKKRIFKSEKLRTEIDNLYLAIQDHDLTKAPEKQLITWLEEMHQLLEELVALTIYVETFDKEIALEIIGLEKQKLLERIWNQATHPVFESFEIRRLRMALEKFKNFSPEVAVKYLQFIYTDYFNTPSLAAVKKLLQPKFGSKQKILNSTKKVAANNKELLAKQGVFDKWLQTLSQDEKVLAKYIQSVMDIRDWRKDSLAQVQTVFGNIAREMFFRVGLDEKLVPYCLPQELEQGIDWLNSQRENIMKRPAGMIVLLNSDGVYEVSLDNITTAIAEVKKVILKQEQSEGATLRGQIGSKGIARGVVRIVMDASRAEHFHSGDILVTGMTRPEFVLLMKQAAAVITDEGGITCHAAIISRELEKPCIIGTKIATKVLHDGDLVEVDANQGIIKILK